MAIFSPRRRPALSPPVLGLRCLAFDTGYKPWMSITGSSSSRRLNRVAVVMGLDEFGPFGGRPRAGESGGGSRGSPKWVRIFRIGPGSVMNAISPVIYKRDGASTSREAAELGEALRRRHKKPLQG